MKELLSVTKKTTSFIDDAGNQVVVVTEQIILIRPAIKQEEKDGKPVSVTMQDMTAIFLKDVPQPIFVKSTFADAKRQVFGDE